MNISNKKIIIHILSTIQTKAKNRTYEIINGECESKQLTNVQSTNKQSTNCKCCFNIDDLCLGACHGSIQIYRSEFETTNQPCKKNCIWPKNDLNLEDKKCTKCEWYILEAVDYKQTELIWEANYDKKIYRQALETEYTYRESNRDKLLDEFNS
jgi:hypothetical protein